MLLGEFLRAIDTLNNIFRNCLKCQVGRILYILNLRRVLLINMKDTFTYVRRSLVLPTFQSAKGTDGKKVIC